jgi:DNA-binding CsgD family transcriptional regulator
MKDFWIALLLAVIVVLKLVDVIEDTGLNLPASHLALEWVLLLLSAIGCIYLIFDMRRRSRAMRHLAATLSNRDAQCNTLNARLEAAKQSHGAAVRDQFISWELTRSEQEVAQLLLKGLSLREIAAVRDTREKTVRQHASSIYTKAGLEGRHALAAWFLEDFLAGADTGAALRRRATPRGSRSRPSHPGRRPGRPPVHPPARG